MSFKEVSILRKAGKTVEALEMAKEDFSKNPDKWSASALFWVYYSISKTDDFVSVPAWQVGSEMLRLADYMDQDEVTLQCLDAAAQHIATSYAHQYRASATVPSVEETNFLELAVKKFLTMFFCEWRDDVRCFSGSVVLRTDRTGNQYGLIDGCFVSAQLVSRIKPEVDVTVVGVRKNGKWRATSIL